MPNPQGLLDQSMRWYPGGAQGYLNDLQKGTGRMMGAQGLQGLLGSGSSASGLIGKTPPPQQGGRYDPFTKQWSNATAGNPGTPAGSASPPPAQTPPGEHGGLLQKVGGLGGAAILLGEGGKVLKEVKEIGQEAVTAGVAAVPESKSYEDQLQDLPDADLDAHIASLRKQMGSTSRKAPTPSPSPGPDQGAP